jgi:hypothetical protein
MEVYSSRLRVLITLALSLALLTLGCGGESGGDGSAGNGGGGTGGGGSGLPVQVPQCVTSAYQIAFRGLFEQLDPLLRYMDTPVGQRDWANQKPPITSLTETKNVPGVYSRFKWNISDVVPDEGETRATADFIEGTSTDLDFGIRMSDVVLIDWDLSVGVDTVVGEGKFSTIGLDNDVVRMTIVDFNPWYEGWANYCRFEITSFNLHLDLATPGSEPFAVIVEYKATSNGFNIDQGAVIFGEDDNVTFTGQLTIGEAPAIPFELELDYGAVPATIKGTVGPASVNCTIDLTTYAVTC